VTLLSVNLNKVALVRNSRETTIPDIKKAARTCIQAGASGITVHPRPDMRHIRPADVYDIASLLADNYPEIEFNIEGNPYAGPELNSAGDQFPGFMSLVRQVRPAQCTLVPDDPQQLTSDHGWDLTSETDRLKPIVEELHAMNVRVSLFMDPDPNQIERAKQLGVDRIELYTGPYADAWGTPELEEIFETFNQAALCAQSHGLGLNAGHDLNLDNLGRFCQVPDLAEVSIGHAIITDALWMGLETTVKAYVKILATANSKVMACN
jgi:pyridoxine 5-phosphate synthase